MGELWRPEHPGSGAEPAIENETEVMSSDRDAPVEMPLDGSVRLTVAPEHNLDDPEQREEFLKKAA